ncbi:MAG TPA: Crp/Fnr family transcriptional regulator [Halomicronema sp.]
MPKKAKQAESDLLGQLIETNYLFKELDKEWLSKYLQPDNLKLEKLYSNRPVYTAFRPGVSLDSLYILLNGGPVIIRSSPLDRVIAISYPGGCFGMRNIAFSYGKVFKAFPSLVEAYKTTNTIKIPLAAVEAIYNDSEIFQERYALLFELREKFLYHLLNCSAYPPQAVAALLRALVYQERTLGNQPDKDGVYVFDLPVEVIARASQLNNRTVEQVLKGMQQVGLIEATNKSDTSDDIVRVIDPEGLKEVYGATRDKVAWWPLK